MNQMKKTMRSRSKLEKIELAKIKFPSEFAEWEQCTIALDEIRNQIKEKGDDSKSLQYEAGKLNVTILLLELAMEITD